MLIKGQSKTTKKRTCRLFNKNNSCWERTWTDVEPGEYSLSDFEISKKLIHLLRHGNEVHREDDGAVQFWRIKENLQKHFPYCPHWSDDKWKKNMAGGGGNKKRYQYCTDSSKRIVYLRALQGHSGRNLIDPTLQYNVALPSNFFQYIYHVRCAINVHSIINSGLILGGQILNNRQTAFFLLVDPMDKNHKDPETIDLNEPRHAQYMHKAWKRHQNAVYWEERIEVLSDSIERKHSSRNTSSLLYSESCQDGNCRSHIQESIYVTSASTKDLLETRLEKIIGLRTCSTIRRTS